MNETNGKMSKLVYLGMLVLDMSKIAMYDYWYDYVKPKCGRVAKIGYMNTDSYIVHIKTEDIYADLDEGVET